MSRRGFGAFLLLTVAWLAAARWVHGAADGPAIGTALVWWGLLVMWAAAAYYAIQEGPAARVTGWLARDFTINLAIATACLFALLDGAHGFEVLGVSGAGWIALAAAVAHPIAVDLPHHRHHADDPAGSPVPQYVPPACFWIDGAVAVGLVVALVLV